MITWNVLRAAGIGAYLMLFVSVAWGLVGTTSLTANRPTKQSSISIHQFASPVGLLLLVVHIVGLIVDRYMKFHILDVLIPLRGSYKPVGVALGILAMYAMIFVVGLSWIRKSLSAKLWRASHILAVPAFTLAMLHGVFAGTDTVRPIMWGLYLSTGLIVTFLLVVRGFTAGLRRRAAFAARRRTSGSIISAPSMLSDGKRTTGSVV